MIDPTGNHRSDQDISDALRARTSPCKDVECAGHATASSSAFSGIRAAANPQCFPSSPDCRRRRTAASSSTAKKSMSREPTGASCSSRHVCLPWLTAGENVALAVSRAFPKYTCKTDEKIRPQKYLELVGIADCYDQKPAELSLGTQQCVSLARALSTGAAVSVAG